MVRGFEQAFEIEIGTAVLSMVRDSWRNILGRDGVGYDTDGRSCIKPVFLMSERCRMKYSRDPRRNFRRESFIQSGTTEYLFRVVQTSEIGAELKLEIISYIDAMDCRHRTNDNALSDL